MDDRMEEKKEGNMTQGREANEKKEIKDTKDD